VARFPKLRKLKTSYVRDKDLLCLSQFSSLHSLRLCTFEKLTDTGLQYLARLNSLRKLQLPYLNQVTEEGVHALTKLPNLEFLSLGSKTGQVCYSIAEMKQLRTVILYALLPEISEPQLRAVFRNASILVFECRARIQIETMTKISEELMELWNLTYTTTGKYNPAKRAFNDVSLVAKRKPF